MDTNMLYAIKEKQNTNSPRSIAMRYGLIAGFISIITGLLLYLTDNSMNRVLGMIPLVIMIIIIVVATKEHRDKELGGAMLYGRGVSVGVLVSLFAGLLGVVWTIVFMTVIAPDFGETLMDAIVEQWEAQGMSEDEIEMAEGFTRKIMTNPIFAAITQLFNTLFMGGIAALIISAVLQKKQYPNGSNDLEMASDDILDA